MASELRIGVMGAGAVGCFIGGKLAALGGDVVFVGRDRLKAELAASGLVMTDLDGMTTAVAREKLAFETDPRVLDGCAVVLCCVKSAHTAEVAEQLARVLARGAIVISLQNGMGNAEVLRAGLRDQEVLGGIVGFNVVSVGNGVFRRATSGPLVIEASNDARVTKLAAALSASGFDVELAKDVRALQWAKLIMNVSNAVSALSGAPTRELLFTPGYRRIVRALMAESLGVMKRAKIRPARLGPLPVTMFPFILGLPNPILRIVARAQLKIDPEARSSMWEDISKGRTTEVDHLNGEIVRLAESCGGEAPLNRRVVAMIHEVEKAGRGSPKLTAGALWAAMVSSGVAGG